MDKVTLRIIELSETHFDLTPDEREIGKKIAHRIGVLYEQFEENIKHKFFLTRFFYFIRDFELADLDFPNRVLYSVQEYFSYYTSEQHIKYFGEPPITKPDRIRVGFPDRWIEIRRAYVNKSP